MNNYSVGSIVNFRGREWVVMPSLEKDVFSLRPITGSEQDTCGIYLPLESERLEPAAFPLPTVQDIGDFESARLLRDAARLLLRNGAGPFRSMGHLSFRPRPYQLVPLLMALRLNPVRLLIADDVGIGKTIEAGLIARELIDRGEVKRLAVICPPYLCEQWQRELSEKFNIDAKIIRTSTLSQLQKNLPGQHLSVFEYYRYMIVSVDFVKSPRRRDAFILHCPELVIVDEAHGCAKGQSEAQQQRHSLIADLARKESGHLVLVTATPHSGVEESFLSLLGFIKPSFSALNFDKLEEKNRSELARHFVQRRRADVNKWLGSETTFPERQSIEVSFALSPEYGRLYRDIYNFAKELVKTEDTRKGFRHRVRYWTALALLRCVMSSPAAATAALMARLERVSENESSEEMDYSPYIFDTTDVQGVLDIVPTHVVSAVSFSESEKRKLREFAKSAQGLKGDKDTKIKKAEEAVREILRDGFSPIVYCRFIASSNYVAEALQKGLNDEFPAIRVISITGALSEEEREMRITELCSYPVRVLVATDCLSEGINLQDGFNSVIHYDLPWNPNRLEQREGRVDRFGQISGQVKAILLYGADNPVDGAVLSVLLRKARHIHKSLGITVPVPVDSESVMDTVIKALFLHEAETPQLGLFEELPVVEVHRKWDHAVERERKSRTRFAQHAIKPEEVAKELDITDSVLGNPQIVERFVTTACQRFGCPVSAAKEYWQIDLKNLPKSIFSGLSDDKIHKIAFEQPVAREIAYIGRNHPLTVAIAEYLFDTALQQNVNRNIAARCGVIRSRDVESLTTLILLRIRFLVKSKEHDCPSVVEECIVTGCQNMTDSAKWLSTEEAESLFEHTVPSLNLSDDEKRYWVNTILTGFDEIQQKTEGLIYNRAEALFRSYERLRQTIKGGHIVVEPLLPADVLSLSIIVPQPKI